MSCTGRVLATEVKTPDEEIDEYLQVLAEMAGASGGGITDPPRTVGDYADWEDNRILDLAAAVGAFLVVSADADLTSMSPWRAGQSLSRHSWRRWSLPRAGHAGDGELGRGASAWRGGLNDASHALSRR